MEYLLNLISLVINPVSIAIFTVYLLRDPQARTTPIILRGAFVFAMAGLSGEIAWSLHNLIYGEYPTDSDIPWWIGKDIGFFFIAIAMVTQDIQFRSAEQLKP